MSTKKMHKKIAVNFGHIVQCHYGGSSGRIRREPCRSYRNIGKQRKARQQTASGLVERDSVLAHLKQGAVPRRDFI